MEFAVDGPGRRPRAARSASWSEVPLNAGDDPEWARDRDGKARRAETRLAEARYAVRPPGPKGSPTGSIAHSSQIGRATSVRGRQSPCPGAVPAVPRRAGTKARVSTAAG